MSNGPEFNPADEDEHGECRNEIQNLLALLGRVYREVGNESPGFKRHALTPGLRDDIRDCLKASGLLGRSPICETDCGDGSTVLDDRPRPGAE